MTLPCRQEAHILHTLGGAANLRKHAKCHLQKDSQFSIQAAGRGGRVHLSTQDSPVDPQAQFQINNYGAMRPSSTESVANQAQRPASQATPTALPPQGLFGTQSQTNQSPAAAPTSPSLPLPKSPRKIICPLLLPKKRQQKAAATATRPSKEGQIATIPKSQ
ncbi:hypothetical protein V496_09691 [Pseudogymnoascus sp. VKM F-4515 (FW-2607)]|nr:hypothetical protein V496_09691 [Pseudogymnoascus sp. VKM F-4515 (FW-2607)]KFY88334.1 hypothetical protein V498_06823 [Pseudogymnoascus sp. VKM F-4517 (FW-2822)]